MGDSDTCADHITSIYLPPSQKSIQALGACGTRPAYAYMQLSTCSALYLNSTLHYLGLYPLYILASALQWGARRSVSARVRPAFLRGQCAVDEEVLSHRAIEASGE